MKIMLPINACNMNSLSNAGYTISRYVIIEWAPRIKQLHTAENIQRILMNMKQELILLRLPTIQRYNENIGHPRWAERYSGKHKCLLETSIRAHGQRLPTMPLQRIGQRYKFDYAFQNVPIVPGTSWNHASDVDSQSFSELEKCYSFAAKTVTGVNAHKENSDSNRTRTNAILKCSVQLVLCALNLTSLPIDR